MHNECEKVKDLISGYVDDSLTISDRTLVAAHIAVCDRCRQAVNETRLLVTRLSGLSGNRAGFDLWPSVAERIAENKRRHTFRHPVLSFRSWKTFAIPAAAVAAGLLFITVRPAGPPPAVKAKAAAYQQQQASTEYKAYIQAYSRFRSAQPLTDRGAIGAVEQLNRRETVSN
ncbi:MAG: zf-HC2 domain-containing protein [Armatimonadota bacterium]